MHATYTSHHSSPTLDATVDKLVRKFRFPAKPPCRRTDEFVSQPS